MCDGDELTNQMEIDATRQLSVMAVVDEFPGCYLMRHAMKCCQPSMGNVCPHSFSFTLMEKKTCVVFATMSNPPRMQGSTGH